MLRVQGDMSATFWDFAKNINKVASLEEVFSEWINRNNISFENAKKEWELINIDIRNIFAANNPAATPPANPAESLVSPVPGKDEEKGKTLIRGILEQQ